MLNSIVLYIIFLSPIFIQFSLYFTERKRNKLIKQLPKKRKKLFNLELTELFEDNIPQYTLLQRSYSYFLLLAICLFSIALGTTDNYSTIFANPYVLFLLITILLFSISRYLLLQRANRFNKNPIYTSFLKQNSDVPLVSNKQLIFRIFLSYLTLGLSVFNLIIFFVLGQDI